MSDDHIRYDVLVQEALRGVVRKVVGEVVRTGLPGEHHFYIAFDTNAPGVRISTRLREQYPDEMTVVLQHQYWDLSVTEHTFEVGLSFGGIPERLLIPFSAIKGFFDPSVQFGLQFEVDTESKAANDSDERDSVEKGPMLAIAENDEAPRDAVDKKLDAILGSDAAPEPAAKPASVKAKPAKPGKPQPVAAKVADDGSAEVVSLDSFRKKP